MGHENPQKSSEIRTNREKSWFLQEANFPVTSCAIYKSFIRDNVSSEHVLCSRQDSKGSHALCRGDSGSFSIIIIFVRWSIELYDP